ncbi:hypothetical protein [Lacrimispora sp.]
MALKNHMFKAHFSHKGENYSDGRIVELNPGNTSLVEECQEKK